MSNLTDTEQEFVNTYTGDILETYRIMGHDSKDIQQLKAKGKALLARPQVQEALKNKSEYREKKRKDIMSSEEVLSYLSKLAKNHDPDKIDEEDRFGNITNKNIPMRERLKALELVGKSEALFIDRQEVSHTISLTDIISQAYEIEERKDEVEVVDYKEVKTEAPKHLEELFEEDIENTQATA